MINLASLSKTFVAADNDVAAVQDLDLSIPDGTFFTLLGPSGCGKTTTMRMLAGLERPDAGTIAVGHRTLFSASAGIDLPANRRRISMVFQSYAVWPHLTVFENVAYPLRVRRASRTQVRQQVDEALELVGLQDLAQRPAPRLSGGQQQRVALARAIVADPEVLILDEPLSNLDAGLRSQMRAELKALQRRLGLSTLYVTHDQQEALALSDEIAVMTDGQLAERGTPHDLYLRPRTRFTAGFLGTTNLLSATVDNDMRPGLNRLDSSIGPIHATARPCAVTGQRSVVLSLRPEQVSLNPTLTDANTSSPNVDVFYGHVTDTEFLGESSLLDVRVGGELLRVRQRGLTTIGAGTRVALEVAHGSAVLLEDGPGHDSWSPRSG